MATKAIGRTALEAFGRAIMGEDEWEDTQYEDCYYAIKAADTMSKRWKEDAAIMQDLSVIKAREAEGIILEIIRYTGD